MRVPSVPGVELRPIPGTIGYAAGSDGVVYTFWRHGWGSPGVTRSPRPMPGSKFQGKGYRRVVIRHGEHVGTMRVHRAVASAFHGPCPSGMVCSHLNGNPSDNRPENLAWESQSDNLRRRYEHGTDIAGERNSQCRLSDVAVNRIREMLGRGISQQRIAGEFGVGQTTISRIKNGHRKGTVSR